MQCDFFFLLCIHLPLRQSIWEKVSEQAPTGPLPRQPDGPQLLRFSHGKDADEQTEQESPEAAVRQQQPEQGEANRKLSKDVCIFFSLQLQQQRINTITESESTLLIYFISKHFIDQFSETYSYNLCCIISFKLFYVLQEEEC